MKKTILTAVFAAMCAGQAYAGVMIGCHSEGDAINGMLFKAAGNGQTITISSEDDSIGDKVYNAAEDISGITGVKIYTGRGVKFEDYGGGTTDSLLLIMDKRTMSADGSFKGQLAYAGKVIELVCREK